MATFLDLRNRLARILMDVPTNTLTEIPLLINEAYSKLQNKHNFFVMQAEAAYVTVYNTRLLGAVPIDFKDFRGRPYRTAFLGRSTWVRVAPDRGNALNYRSDVDLGEPQAILKALEDTTGLISNFEIYPLPNGTSDYSDGEFRITVPYWKYLARLSGDSDTNWFLQQDDALEYIVREAAANAFEFNEDDNRADRWHKRAEETYHDILLLDKYRWLSMSDTLIPHQGADNTFMEF